MKTTQLHEFHEKRGHMIEFAGYDMPVWYTSISEEHLAVRNSCGAFDVSHMGRIHVSGPDSGRLLDGLVPTNVASQPAGKSIYTLLLNEDGGILDDLIIMKMSEGDYLVVVNAVNAQSDFKQILGHMAGFDASVQDITGSSAMIALQGPDSERILQPFTMLNLSELKRFRCIEAKIAGLRSLISRTGYTGEDGFELIIYDATALNPSNAISVWTDLTGTAIPCGLGARDSLRIEAGYPLYGTDINLETSPFEADLAWVLSADKKGYVGFEALARIKELTPKRIRRGMVLDEKIPRNGFRIQNTAGESVGNVTSGTFSPILRKGIGIGLVAKEYSEPGSPVRVVVRDSAAQGHLVRPPFYDESLYGWKRLSKGK